VAEVLAEKDQRGQRAALQRDLDLEQVGTLWPSQRNLGSC
jgi:hypothetical protein